MIKNSGGNISGGDFLGGNFPGRDFPRGSLMGGNFPGGSFPDTGFFNVTCFAKIFLLLFFSLKHDILIRKHTSSEMLSFLQR